MASWIVNANKLIYEIQPNPKLGTFFQEYLSHRMRFLFAHHKKFLLPETWSFQSNQIELSFFDHSTLSQANQLPSQALYQDFESLRDNEIIPVLKTFLDCAKEGFFGFSPFYPVNAK